MNLNQALAILTESSNARDARVVLRAIRRDANNDKLSFIDSLRVRWAARQLRRGVPVAKIIRRRRFYGLEFETDRHTMDPRPDSETIVDAVLKLPVINQKSPITILDLGTGTGCLIAAIVANMPNATGIGIDKSRPACHVAQRNIKRLGLADKIKIEHGDFNHQSPVTSHKSPFDIIISNPPYIAIGDTRVDAGARWDPKIALYAGPDGLDAYRAIAQTARPLIKSNGQIFLEIGAGQSALVRQIFTNAGWKFIESHRDLGGVERVLTFKP